VKFGLLVVARTVSGVMAAGHLLGFVWFVFDLPSWSVLPGIALMGCATLLGWLDRHYMVALALVAAGTLAALTQLWTSITVDESKAVMLGVEVLLLSGFGLRFLAAARTAMTFS
jgi:hypothetical protein